MDREQFETEYRASGVVLVVRLGTADALDDVARCASDAGVRFLEVTTNTVGGIEWVRERSSQYPALHLGVGTVMNADDARSAIDAGAEFLVSPHVDPALTEYAENSSIAHVAGALTPSEIVAASAAGAAAVKVFPVTQLGAGYIRDLRGPLPDISLVAIGGVDEHNAAEYLAAGASGVGVGGSFVNDRLVAERDWDLLTQRLTLLLERVAGHVPPSVSTTSSQRKV